VKNFTNGLMNFIKVKHKISEPSLFRLCKIYSLIEEMLEAGTNTVSSKEIGLKIGAAPHNVRKDLSNLKEPGVIGSGYELTKLKASLEEILGLKRYRKACIAGLSGLGMAILDNQAFLGSGFRFVAGFDPNINVVETLKTSVPVYPSYEIETVVNREGIDFAVMTIQGDKARAIADVLIRSGIKGIINFSSMMLVSDRAFIRNIDLPGEFRFLSALLAMQS